MAREGMGFVDLGDKPKIGWSIHAGAFGDDAGDGRTIPRGIAHGARCGFLGERSGGTCLHGNDGLYLRALALGKNFQLSAKILDALAHSPQSHAKG